jgi:hypothetical protein
MQEHAQKPNNTAPSHGRTPLARRGGFFSDVAGVAEIALIVGRVTLSRRS